jgi:uncharacterized protein DUF4440
MSMGNYLRIHSAWLPAFFCVITVIAIGSLQLVARTADEIVDGKKLTEEFAAIEQEWLTATAKNDTATLRTMLGDDFIGTAFGGNIINKQDLLPEGDVHEASGPWATAKVQDITVHGYINSAVVMGKVGMPDPKNPGFRFTKVYMKRRGRWQLVAAHLSHLENP